MLLYHMSKIRGPLHRLPARLFDAEWDALRHGDGTAYKPFSQIEMQIPTVFIFLYAALSVVLVWEIFGPT